MENEEKVNQTEETQKDIEVTEDMAASADNVTENVDDTDKKRKAAFFQKNKDKERIQELEEEVEKIKVEKAELNDRFLRLYSEFDNYKNVSLARSWISLQRLLRR